MYIVPNTLKNFPCPNFEVLKKLRFFIYIFFFWGGGCHGAKYRFDGGFARLQIFEVNFDLI